MKSIKFTFRVKRFIEFPETIVQLEGSSIEDATANFAEHVTIKDWEESEIQTELELIKMDSNIPGECYSDDRVSSAKFNAVPFFMRCSREDVLALASTGFSGDYPADSVAHYVASYDPQVADMFSYLEAHPEVGFECSIDKDQALEWISQYRPDIQVGFDDDLEA